MIYLLHGPDEFGIAETLASMRARLAAEDEAAELNTTELSGAKLTVGELEAAASALPFMGDRRLVIVSGLVERCNPRGGDAGGKDLGAALTSYLPGVPDTTRLVFVAGDVHANNPVRKWLEQQAPSDDTVIVKAFDAPKAAALPTWLVRRASQRGGEIERAAAASLADALNREGTVDLRLADGELVKLLTYADGRAVTTEDVALLVTPVTMERIFAFTDALADRDGPAAMTHLHRFLTAGEPPLRLMALVARQVRLLTQARGMLDEGATDGALKAALPVPAFVVPKLKRQADRFSLDGLLAALRDLARLDADIKTGAVDAALALDLFVAGLCASSGGAPGAHRV